MYSSQSGKTINPIIEVSYGDLFQKGTKITGNEPIFSLFSVAGVKYIITHNEDNYTLNEEKFKKLTTIAPFTIWEFQSYPRLFLTTDYEISKTVFDKELSNHVILEKDPHIGRNMECTSLQPKITDYSNNHISITTKTDCPALLYLSDTYYPGWKAYVDKNETEIFKSNYAFRSVVVPSGSHELTMDYDPLSFKVGFYTSLFTSIGIIITACTMYVKKTLS